MKKNSNKNEDDIPKYSKNDVISFTKNILYGYPNSHSIISAERRFENWLKYKNKK